MVLYDRKIYLIICFISFLIIRSILACRNYSSSLRRTAADAAASSSAVMKINFCTPHETILDAKEIDKVMIPGEAGEFGITQGHSPLISQLKPGVVTVVHTGVSKDFYFLSNIK